MGCFTGLMKKNTPGHIVLTKHVNVKDDISETLPEPLIQIRALQSAPPSFKSRTRRIPLANKITSRMRALSAPSSFDNTTYQAHKSADFYDPDDSKHRTRDQLPSPKPLPLPSPPGSFKIRNSGDSLSVTGSLFLLPMASLRYFSYEDILAACDNFVPSQCMPDGVSLVSYKASFRDDASGLKNIEASVTCLCPSTLSLKEFISDLNMLASLQHPNICRLIGFHAREGSSEQRMLVHESLFNGSLDRLLHGGSSSDVPYIDWNSRMKVALSAAQGLAFLHEEGPFRAMYSEFSTSDIQVEKDFTAKLSRYGCVNHPDFANTSSHVSPLESWSSLSPETAERGILTPKSNVWSFGVILLEIMTGRGDVKSSRNYENGRKDMNLVKWSRPFLSDDSRLSLIMDPKLKGRFPMKAARAVADIAQRCTMVEPSLRPTMRTVAENLKLVQDIRCFLRFPLQEPGMSSGKQMSRSPSLNGVVAAAGANRCGSTIPCVSPVTTPPPLSGRVGVLRTCSSDVSLAYAHIQKERQERRGGIKGF